MAYLRGYRWSSYRAYIGLEPAPEWLTCDSILSWMGARGPQQQLLYRQYVEEAVREGLRPLPWTHLEAQPVLGDEHFVERVREHLHGDEREQTGLKQLRKRPSFDEVVRAVERLKGQAWKQFARCYGDWGRDAVLTLAYEHCALTLKELGCLAEGLDYVSVCIAIRRFRIRLEKDSKLATLIAQAKMKLKIEKL